MSPPSGEEGAGEGAVELAHWFLISDPGHGLSLSLGEAGLDIISSSVADEEGVELIHKYQ